MESRFTLEQRRGHVPSAVAAEVLALADATAAADHAHPLAEDAVLRLRHDDHPPAEHVLARAPDHRLIGYAQAVPIDAESVTAEVFVHPDQRRRGLGRRLLTTVLDTMAPADAGAGWLRVWSHGDQPGAAGLARALGFARVRSLHQLRRPLAAPIPASEPPPGVRLRPFRPGEDDHAWLALNARAFADHPEQGRWTIDDLRARLAEPWFDPAGFLLAVRESDGALLGFHWTKVHGPGNPHHREPIGEVYVLGVDPAAHGTGLGTTLTLAGLDHLRGLGLPLAMLYVDDANQPALRLYRRLGFDHWSTDVMYAGPPAHP